ncbi:methyltransferase family protein [Halanaerobium saccharolyticum]|uniref:Methyltransferase family protein n=1 Tax=Halanaerobium saccharolyticum TaxID=43595 RepID=A0A4R7YTQ6_9FIRM|nr:class I SAM-dependent methyltransferase [Halanaerobium saccharolyticum]RAK04979.1 methyltransferase family protein [Halanaerobium saccharolyticum]TDV98333.1 methyltransferase family protein [Halanaerobium saccharolyticum]TDX51331.1 methyltransferase family protein [Halanaerobium saccharolyticum]
MDCIICGSSDLELLDIQNKYYHCQDCEVIFLDPAERVAQAEEKERYEGHDNNHQNEGYVKMFEDFIEELVEPNINLENINDVLEFGCGPGPVLADLLEAKELEVDRYDPYFFPEKVFVDKKYDLITSTEVFEHFSDPIKEMKLLTSHLKENAYLAVMTSFHPGPEEFEDWWYKWDSTHIVFYNQKTFSKIASDFGLEIIYTDQKKYILFKA